MAELVIVRVSLQIAWGLLSNKLIKKLKQGSPTDETLRQLLLDKFQKLHEELNSLRRKELVAAVSFMENGYELFLKDTLEAKKEFSKARDAAQMAFGVVSETTDKLLATKIMLASAMHEFDDKVETSLSLCLKYVTRLNGLPEITEACAAYLKKGLVGRFRSITGSDKRQVILKSLSEINRSVWEYLRLNDVKSDEVKWPAVNCGDKYLNPVYDLIPVREYQEITSTAQDRGRPVAMVANAKKLFVAYSQANSETEGTKHDIEVVDLEMWEVKFLSGHSAVVLSLVSAQGKVFSGSYDRSILVWDVTNLESFQKLGEHDGAVRSLVANATTLFSAGTDKLIKVWDIETLNAVTVLHGHEFPISLLDFKHHLFSYAPGESIRIWNIKSWSQISMIPDPGSVSGMYCSVSSKLFLHCGMDVRVWNLGQNKEEGTLKNIGKVSVHVPKMKLVGVSGESICHYTLDPLKCLYNQALGLGNDADISLLYYNHELGMLFLGGKQTKQSRSCVILVL